MLYRVLLTPALAGFLVSTHMPPATAKTRVLVVHAFSKTLLASARAGTALRNQFVQQYGADLDLYSQYLDLAGNVQPEEKRRSGHNYIGDVTAFERWSLPLRSSLPDTIRQFKKPSLWKAYPREVVVALGCFGLVTLAVAILLVQVRRRMKAESYLRQSEERLNYVAASAGIGLWQYDIPSDKFWSSEHCGAIFKLPTEIPLTKEILMRHVHPQDRSIAAASIRAATSGSHAETLLDFRIVRPDGQVRSIRSRSRSTFGADGEPVRVSGTFRDLRSL